VGAFADDNVTLLILDLCEHLAENAHLLLQRVLRSLALGDVDDAVDVEADLLCVGRPVFVAEAVEVASIHVGGKAMIAAADGALVDLVCVGWVLDLQNLVSLCRNRTIAKFACS
jgi:hypothetical protein